jgi:mono/diheme cytochrome c family protein
MRNLDNFVRQWFTVCLLGWIGLAEASAAERVRFNRDVLPILADNCFACHGFDRGARQAGLRLDQRAGATTKLESGTQAIVAGNVTASALWARVSSTDHDQVMPPPATGKRLTAAQRETLRLWIEQGAEYEAHWAFLRPQQVEPPAVAGVTSAIDRFIRSRLAAESVAPSPPADRATLIRRVTLDLTGLPPTPLEVDAFVNDARGDAFERVVDRLLASEHFGERWARWWLDLAHYGDSDGYLQDFIRPVAWRYRQWVVEAFNRDLPFDQFTVEQLAGDLLPHATVSQRMGTGFLRNTLSNREGGADLEEYRVKQVIDRTVTLGTTWLGLTTGCAECHDHKFDAISQREFYQLYAFFNDADEVNVNAPLPGEQEPFEAAKAEHDRKRAELLAPFAAPLAELQAEWERTMLHTETHPGEDFSWDRALELLGLQWGQSLGEGQLEGLNIIKTSPAERTQDQRDRLLDYFLKAPPPALTAKFTELKLGELNSKLVALAKTLPPVTRAPAMMKSPAKRTTHIHVRGEYLRKGDIVQAGTLAALPALHADGEPDRLALARWLVSPEHPLTARVAVNRLWQELFGRGLVATSDNFGVRGDRPSHPELLDWLAVQFQRDGWSVKSLLRRIVLSETYRQSSAARPDLAARDPLNKLLARQARLRLSGESVRDATLAVSGLLNRNIGGPSVKPPQPAAVSKEGYSNIWEASTGADRHRRGLYTWIQRTSPFAQFVTFDLPDTSRSCTRRERSNTPLQALNLLNDPAFLDAAQALADRVQREVRGDDEQRLAHAFVLVLSRPIKPEESKRLLAYLQQQRTLLQSEGAPDPASAWVAVSSVLLNLDEFINRE